MPEKILCCNCSYLYIKDMVTGICDCPNSGRNIVRPNDCCAHWKERAKIFDDEVAEDILVDKL